MGDNVQDYLFLKQVLDAKAPTTKETPPHLQEFYDRFGLDAQKILADYRLGYISRQVSQLGRKEVFMGRAKFGIFGGGKELPQLAAAHFFEKGDWRSGYYRDQTLMFALGIYHPRQLFAQLYADPSLDREPVSGGRLMTGHFGTHLLDEHGQWIDLTKQVNSSCDISPTAAQMPRALGIAWASKLYRENPALHDMDTFSKQGKEVSFVSIGDASCAEGPFWETINAAGVLQVPFLVSIWDDGYGISVASDEQIIKGSISDALAGMQHGEKPGYEILTVRAWDYPALMETFQRAFHICRHERRPAFVHVKEVTQVDGHSTSGSHEHYKSKERLEWEAEYDGLRQFRLWITRSGIASEEELVQIEKEVEKETKQHRKEAYDAYVGEVKQDRESAIYLLEQAILEGEKAEELEPLKQGLDGKDFIFRAEIVRSIKLANQLLRGIESPAHQSIQRWLAEMRETNHERYSSKLVNESPSAVVNLPAVPAEYEDEPKMVDGRLVMNACFDAMLARDPRVLAFGEDVGKIGDVNKAFDGLQTKHGELRVSDTGIRELTIAGQAIGLAMRGLRPIAEIQYLDYIMYAIQILSDDLATVRYRSFGRQKAPVIIRTRGHRLEGVWHSGSPMGALLSACRGIYVCCPRNMVQAAGLYNTLLEGDDPAIVIECLNGYRLKEALPSNIGEMRVPLGIPEVVREGEDLTIVTYGAMVRVCQTAAESLAKVGISVEIVDVQTLQPFDIHARCAESIKKTGRVLFADEDVPGGATGYMMQQVLEVQGAYYYLDAKPKTISSWAHRPAYATDGDYFSKPNAEDVFDYVYEVLNEANPERWPALY